MKKADVDLGDRAGSAAPRSAEPRRSKRLRVRFTAEEYALIERAAFLRTDGDLALMIVLAALEVARATIQEHETTAVVDSTREELYAALLTIRGNPRLDALFARPVPKGYDL